MAAQPDPQMTNRKSRLSLPRRLARGLSISLAVFVVLLLGAEFAVRVFTDTHRPLLVVDSVLGRRLVCAFDGVVLNEEAGRDVHLRFNDQGFRFPDLPFEKPPGTRRLVLLGDSMIAALEVEEQETAAWVLQERLNQLDETSRWEVLNFGIPGSGTGPEYVFYRELAHRYQPDVVLCAFFVGNDFGDNSTRLTQRKRIYFDLDEEGELVQLPFPTLRVHLNELLNEYSRLYVWQKKMLDVMKRQEIPAEVTDPLAARHAWHGDSVRASEWIYYTGEDETCAHAWKVTRAEIHALSSAVAADGAEFALVMLPSSLQVHDEEFAYLRKVAGSKGGDFDPAYPGNQLAEICAEVGTDFIDLVPQFREACPSHSELAEDEWLYIGGGGHFNLRGNATVGMLLAAEVEARFIEK